MSASEPFQFHFASYRGPCRGFLDLPPELRDMIYNLALIARSSRGVGYLMCPRTHLNRRRGPLIPKKRLPYNEYSHKHRLIHHLDGLTMGVLRVNKQVHLESARYFYGNNDFKVPVGLNCRDWYCNCDTYLSFFDSFMDIPCYYLKMIKKCDLWIELPILELKGCKNFYLKVKRRIARFAETMHDQEHSLKMLRIALTGWQGGGRGILPELPSLQNVLEPLGSIHGISEVTITGVKPEFRAKLKKALTGEKVAFSPIEESYGTRMVKFKGRKRIQRYKLSRYYDSKYNWIMDRPAALDLNESNNSEDIPMTGIQTV